MTIPYRNTSSFQPVFICLSKLHIANSFSTSSFLSTATQKKRTELADSSNLQILQYCKFLFAYHTIFSNFITLEYLFLKSAVYVSKYTFCVFSVAYDGSNLQFGNVVFQIKKVCLFRFSSFLITISVEILDSLFPFFHQHFTVLSPFSPTNVTVLL